ncbi:MAG: ankyrin repeat domain-containing protein [Alphaproteobacteria bacterium]
MMKHGIFPRLFLVAALALAAAPAFAQLDLFASDPLLEAIRFNNIEQVEKRLLRGGSTEIADFDRRTAIIYAATTGNADIMEILIKYKAQITHRDKLGNTALFYAASLGNIDALELLIEKGAKVNGENKQGITPLMEAARNGRLEVARILVDARADTARRDYTGRTALMWADWSRKAAVARYLRGAGVRE